MTHVHQPIEASPSNALNGDGQATEPGAMRSIKGRQLPRRAPTGEHTGMYMVAWPILYGLELLTVPVGIGLRGGALAGLSRPFTHKKVLWANASGRYRHRRRRWRGSRNSYAAAGAGVLSTEDALAAVD
jgi:hypothetical protein